MKSVWFKSKRQVFAEDRSMKLVELVESVEPDLITNVNMEMIVRELLGQGIDSDIIMDLSLSIREKNSFKDRIGGGSAKEYTEDEHIRWINNIMDTYVPDGLRKTYTITNLTYGTPKRAIIENKWLDKYGLEFDTNYLRDLSLTHISYDEKRTKVNNYYNHFFLITTGQKKNGIYYRKYNADGTIREVGLFQDPAQFSNFATISMRLYDEASPCNTAKWWFNSKSITYDRVVFKPYGIKRNAKLKINPNEFNTFSGLRMKFVPDYNKSDMDVLGDRIHRHLSQVICWDNKTEYGVNEDLYNYHRAWLYKLIIRGERTHVSWVNYSKKKGTGKSIESNGLMKWVIGSNLSMLNSCFGKLIKDTFTDYWEDCIFATLEEMPQFSGDKDSRAGWDFCKSLTTEDTMSSRGFMTAPDKMDIHVNLMINTNHFHSIDPEYMNRRAVVNIINPIYKDNHDYFAKAIEAFDSYEGWENYIHRYLWQQRGAFSHIKIEPMEALLPDTHYRRMLNARGNDSIVYFFKTLLENMANPDTPETPYKHYIEAKPSKCWSIKKLYDLFNIYKEENGVADNMYRTEADFEKALMVKFEINIVSMKNITRKDSPMYQGQSVKTTPKVFRDGRAGKCVEIDEQLINAILDVVKLKQINTTILEMTEEDIIDRFEDPADYLFREEQDFLPETDDI